MRNRFSQQKNSSHLLRRILSSAAVFACAAFLLLRGSSAVSQTADDSQAESLQLAIIRSAVHCYATEGAYPESLAYLRDHYGITWDESRYVVDYEIIGSNLRPQVTVIPLGKGAS